MTFATYRTMGSTCFRSSLLLLLSLLASVFSSISTFGQGGLDPTTMAMPGAVRDSASSQNSVEVESLGRFAVEEHNKKENSLLEFARVVKAKEQVVAGTMHHLTLEVVDAGKKKLYEAKIWVKPWANFKELHEFKHAGDVPADHGTS